MGLEIGDFFTTNPFIICYIIFFKTHFVSIVMSNIVSVCQSICPISPSLGPSGCPYAHLSDRQMYGRTDIQTEGDLSVHLSIIPSVCPLIPWSFFLSVCQSVCHSIRPSVLSVHLSFNHFICPSISPSNSLSIHWSVHLSISHR